MGLFNFVWNTEAAVKATVEAASVRLRHAGEVGYRVMQDRTPVDTGKLKASGGYIFRQEDLTVELYEDMPYAAAVEFGTHRTKAQPHVRPGIYAAAEALGDGGSVEAQYGPHADFSEVNPANVVD